jgi:molybdopterin-synthase adenylyltransferase
MMPDARDRYSRQIRLPEVGEEGQARITAAHVAVVGCGALGSFHAGALARAGVGTLTLIDRDYVEWSNLQRQWLFTEADAADGAPKAVAAARQIATINSACKVEPIVKDLTASNIDDLLADVGLILDGTDNFETRYLINDFAVREEIPWVYGAAVGSYGIVMPVLPGKSACLACVYPEPPSGSQPTCETAGVLGPLTSAIASLQTAAALKILVTGDAPRRITTLEVWAGWTRQISMPERDPDCPCCGRQEFRYLNPQRRTPISLCGRNAVQIHERTRPLDLEQLRRELSPLGEVRANEFALRFTVPPYELTIFPDGRAIIKGTTDTGVARSLYSRYVGN